MMMMIKFWILYESINGYSRMTSNRKSEGWKELSEDLRTGMNTNSVVLVDVFGKSDTFDGVDLL